MKRLAIKLGLLFFLGGLALFSDLRNCKAQGQPILVVAESDETFQAATAEGDA